ncbi:MAG: SRPBCC family protein [Anaerolineales bacterium]
MPSKNKTTVKAEPGKQELYIIREFDAPRELVFRAHTDPALFVKWIGPHGYEMILKEFEPVNGGRYRYIHKDPQGNEYGFHGCFHEISMERLTQTFEFEGYAGHVSLETATLEELPGNRTRVTIHSVYQSVVDRDGMVQNGMETGVREGYERLDDTLKEIK